ncbi:MAG: polysaccharide deacetylase family protein, partial [Paraclostridium sp.]
MKRRIKPIILNVATVIVLILSIYIMRFNIISAKLNEETYKTDLNTENIALTELMLKASKVTEKGPKPKPAKVAYLTIDDGPSKYTNQLLDILNKNGVKGTFFMLDKNMINYQNQVNRAVKEGHAVGFHSISHDINILYNSTESTLAEFDKCKQTLNTITGNISNLVRLPYGSKPYAPRESYNVLINNGYKVWDWNLDTKDWKATSDEIVNNVEIYSNNNRELVILMHEKEQTVEVLQEVIDILKSKG